MYDSDESIFSDDSLAALIIMGLLALLAVFVLAVLIFYGIHLPFSGPNAVLHA